MATVTVMATDRRRKTKREPRSWLDSLTIDRATLARYALIGLVSVIAAGAAFANALGAVTKASHPEVAIRFDSRQPAALAALADESLLRADKPKAREDAVGYARAALAASPLSPAAVRIIALATADPKRPLAEKQLMALSRKLSRRDLGAHLWWIEYHVGLGQAGEALKSYDLALRTSMAARSLLLPILYTALENPQIQDGLVPYLKAERSWVPELIIYATATGRSAARLVRPLVQSGNYPRTAEFSRLARQTMENLIASGDFVDVERIYAALPTDPGLLVQAGFSKASADQQYVPVSWELSGLSTSGAELEVIEGEDGRTQSRIRAFTGPGGVTTTARKLLFLKPGRYQLASTASVTLSAPQQDAKWVLTCASKAGGTPLLSHPLIAGQTRNSAPSSFEIQGNCPAQWLQLQMSAEGDISGSEILVNFIDLKRL